MHNWTISDSELISMYVNGKSYREIIELTGTNCAYLANLVRGLKRNSKPIVPHKKK